MDFQLQFYKNINGMSEYVVYGLFTDHSYKKFCFSIFFKICSN